MTKLRNSRWEDHPVSRRCAQAVKSLFVRERQRVRVRRRCDDKAEDSEMKREGGRTSVQLKEVTLWLWRQIKEARPRNASKIWKRQENRFSPRRSTTLLTFWLQFSKNILDFWAPELQTNTIVLFHTTKFVMIRYSRDRKLIPRMQTILRHFTYSR